MNPRRVGKYEVGRSGLLVKELLQKSRNSETGYHVALKILDKEKVVKHKMAQPVHECLKYLFTLLSINFLCFISLMMQIKMEVATMNLIKHPNVVRLYEVF
ncbi:putative non-specific serine/threonine protein kinase [Helianthus anomalus]